MKRPALPLSTTHRRFWIAVCASRLHLLHTHPTASVRSRPPDPRRVGSRTRRFALVRPSLNHDHPWRNRTRFPEGTTLSSWSTVENQSYTSQWIRGRVGPNTTQGVFFFSAKFSSVAGEQSGDDRVPDPNDAKGVASVGSESNDDGGETNPDDEDWEDVDWEDEDGEDEEDGPTRHIDTNQRKERVKSPEDGKTNHDLLKSFFEEDNQEKEDESEQNDSDEGNSSSFMSLFNKSQRYISFDEFNMENALKSPYVQGSKFTLVKYKSSAKQSEDLKVKSTFISLVDDFHVKQIPQFLTSHVQRYIEKEYGRTKKLTRKIKSKLKSMAFRLQYHSSLIHLLKMESLVKYQYSGDGLQPALQKALTNVVAKGISEVSFFLTHSSLQALMYVLFAYKFILQREKMDCSDVSMEKSNTLKVATIVPGDPDHRKLIHNLGFEVVPIQASALTQNSDSGYIDTSKYLPSLHDIESTYAQETFHVMVIQNPAIPTGVMFTTKDLTSLSKLCREKNILLISDESLQNICYSKPPSNILSSIDDLESWNQPEDHLVAIGDFSKYYRTDIFGRVGWTATTNKHIRDFFETHLHVLRNPEFMIHSDPLGVTPWMVSVYAAHMALRYREADDFIKTPLKYFINLKLLLQVLPSCGFRVPDWPEGGGLEEDTHEPATPNKNTTPERTPMQQNRMAQCRPHGGYYVYADATAIMKEAGCQSVEELCSLFEHKLEIRLGIPASEYEVNQRRNYICIDARAPQSDIIECLVRLKDWRKTLREGNMDCAKEGNEQLKSQ